MPVRESSLRRAVLFDLDGTLTDPRVGITRSIQHAMTALGRVPPPEEDLLWCIGPPLQASFAELLGPAQVDAAIARYRERFAEVGLFENVLYEGIPEALSLLRSEGYRVYLATSKPHVFARCILEHFGIAEPFHGVYGSELDGTRTAKAELIAHLLRTEELDPQDAVMVGDREHDMAGGRACGLRCVGVTYGYGSEEELTVSGAYRLAHSPGGIAEAVDAVFMEELK